MPLGDFGLQRANEPQQSGDREAIRIREADDKRINSGLIDSVHFCTWVHND